MVNISKGEQTFPPTNGLNRTAEKQALDPWYCGYFCVSQELRGSNGLIYESTLWYC